MASYNRGLGEGLLAGMTIKQTIEESKATQAMNQEQLKKVKRDNDLIEGAQIQAQIGGLPAVLDYYKKNAPEVALQMEKIKTDLDNSVLSNKEKSQTIQANSLTLLGGIGAKIASLPTLEDRMKFHTENLEQIRQIDPNMPETYNKAAPRYNVAAAASVSAVQQYDLIQKANKDTMDLDLSQQQNRIQAGKIFRNDYEAIVKPFLTLNADYKALSSLASLSQEVDPKTGKRNAPAQLSLIFKFMKSLDPTSAVRETEYANAANAGGIPEKLRNYYNKAKDGTFLTNEQVQDFMSAATEAYKPAYVNYKQATKEYNRLAEVNGLDSKKVYADLIVDSGLPEDNNPQIQELMKDHGKSLEESKQILGIQ